MVSRGSIEIIPFQSESSEKVEALRSVLASAGPRTKLFRCITNGQTLNGAEACITAASFSKDPYVGLVPDGTEKQIKLAANYPNDEDHYVIDTDLGPVRVYAIKFEAAISVKTSTLPVTEVQDYRSGDTPIAQVALVPIEINGDKYRFEFHHVEQTGETHILMRKLGESSGSEG